MEKSLGISKIRTLDYRDLLIFLIPFCIFLYYLHIFNPGILTYDSFNQLHQISTGNFTRWHPFFHTFIEMMCLKAYNSTVSVGIVQILVFCAMWTAICKYNRKDSQKAFALQAIFTLAISIIPINAIYSITLWKDILFSYFLMFFCFMIEILLDRKGNVGLGFGVLISFVMAFLTQIRLNGRFVVIPMLVILAIYLWRKNRQKKLHIIIPALTVVFFILMASLSVAYDVEGSEVDAVCDIVSHMLADYDLNLDLESGDRAKIHKLISEKDIKEHYNIYYKDHLRTKVNEDVWEKDKTAYISMAAKYSLKHPKHFIEYIFGMASITWKVVRDEGWSEANGVIYRIDTETQQKIYYRERNETPIADFENPNVKNNGTPEFDAVTSWATFSGENVVLTTLFNSPALYMYLSIVLILALCLITKSRDLLLVYLPNALNIFVVFISIPAQQTRYLYPNLLVFYLLVIISIGVLAKRRHHDNEIDEQLNA